METNQDEIEETREACLCCGKDVRNCKSRPNLICGQARHLRIKADDIRWRTETSELRGGTIGDVELRNCIACGSTLARPL